MSGWRAGLVAFAVGALVLAAGYLVPRLGGGGEGGGGSEAGDASLSCVPALLPMCRQVAADLGTEAEAWRPGESLPADAVVVAPGPDLPAGVEPGPVVARSPIVVAGWLERWPLLVEACGGEVDFGCVAGLSGTEWVESGGPETWGTVSMGLADAGAGEAELLAWWAVRTAGPGDRFSSGLRLTAASDSGLAEDFVLFGASRADVIVVSEVAVAPQLANAPLRGGRIELAYPDPQPWVEYRATTTSGAADALARALLGGDVQSGLGAFGLRPAAGEASGLPDGLGVPGSSAPAPDAATRATLVEEWDAR